VTKVDWNQLVMTQTRTSSRVLERPFVMMKGIYIYILRNALLFISEYWTWIDLIEVLVNSMHSGRSPDLEIFEHNGYSHMRSFFENTLKFMRKPERPEYTVTWIRSILTNHIWELTYHILHRLVYTLLNWSFKNDQPRPSCLFRL